MATGCASVAILHRFLAYLCTHRPPRVLCTHVMGICQGDLAPTTRHSGTTDAAWLPASREQTRPGACYGGGTLLSMILLVALLADGGMRKRT